MRLIALAIALLVPGLSPAQPQESSVEVSGTIGDTARRPVEGARVVFRGAKRSSETVTGAEGAYRIRIERDQTTCEIYRRTGPAAVRVEGLVWEGSQALSRTHQGPHRPRGRGDRGRREARCGDPRDGRPPPRIEGRQGLRPSRGKQRSQGRVRRLLGGRGKFTLLLLDSAEQSFEGAENGFLSLEIPPDAGASHRVRLKAATATGRSPVPSHGSPAVRSRNPRSSCSAPATC